MVTPTVELRSRIEALERRAIADDVLHASFAKTDGQTALEVANLTRTISDPENGLIVRLREFQNEVRQDRRAFKAWIAGAAFSIGTIFALVTIYAPTIRLLLGISP